MGKLVDQQSQDAQLNDIKNNGNLLVALTAQPADYTAANADKIAEQAVVAGDYALADGVVSGRRLTVAAKNGVPITRAGTNSATHIALLDTVNLRVKYVTTCASTALTQGGQVNFGGFSYEVRDPA